MTFEVALFARHEVRYTTQKPVPVNDVISSLQGLQRISAHFLPRTLSALTGVEILSADLYLEGFKEGSFVEDVMIKIIFPSQDELDAFLEKANESVVGDAKGLIVKHPTVSTAVLSLLIYGAAHAYGAMNEGMTSPSIQANTNLINIIGAKSHNMDPAGFARAVVTSVGRDRKKLAKDVAKVLAPAKNELAAGVVFDGNDKLNVSPDTVRATPAARLLRLVEADPR